MIWTLWALWTALSVLRAPTQTSAVTPAPNPAVKIGGWMVFRNPDSLEDFARHATQIDDVMAEWVTCAPDGQAVRVATITLAQRARAVLIAHNHRITLYGMVQNSGEDFEAKRVEAFLYDPAKRQNHIAQLVRIAQEDRLAGLDLDYESLAARDRAPYSAFVQELATALHRAGKRLSVTVHPKEAEPGTWDGAIAHDYAKIGAAADVMRVMCYDFHWSTSDAGAIAPTDWVERVMKCALAAAPKRKLAMGVACYGYDWSQKPATSLTWKDWLPHAAGQTIDPRSGEYVSGKVDFAGAKSAQAKFALARRLGIPRISFWYIGAEEPEFWAATHVPGP